MTTPCPCATPAVATESTPACPDNDFTLGRYTLSVRNGCLDVTKNPSTLVDGVYTNPTVTVEGGEVVAVTAGTRPVNTLTVPWWATGTGTGTTAGVSSRPGNLITSEADGVYAAAYFTSTPTVSVGGDGSVLNPWTLTIADGFAPSGVTKNACGYKFESGQVKQWKQPLTTFALTAAAQNVLKATVSDCGDVTLDLLATSGQIRYSKMLFCTTNAPTTHAAKPCGYLEVVSGTGTTSAVRVFTMDAGNTIATPPATFATVAAAIAWVDQQTCGCVAEGGG